MEEETLRGVGGVMRQLRVGVIAGVVALSMFGMGSTAAAQGPPTGISVVDGKTAPVFDYDQAIRERVYIPNGQDADLDGVEDRTAIEIMRPKESGPTSRSRRSSRRARTTRAPATSSSASASATSTATASTTAGRSGTTTTSSRAGTR